MFQGSRKIIFVGLVRGEREREGEREEERERERGRERKKEKKRKDNNTFNKTILWGISTKTEKLFVYNFSDGQKYH